MSIPPSTFFQPTGSSLNLPQIKQPRILASTHLSSRSCPSKRNFRTALEFYLLALVNSENLKSLTTLTRTCKKGTNCGKEPWIRSRMTLSALHAEWGQWTWFHSVSFLPVCIVTNCCRQLAAVQGTLPGCCMRKQMPVYLKCCPPLFCQ